MKRVPINAAREIGEKASARKVVIIALDDEGYCITTWGKTRAECQALARWSGGGDGDRVAVALAETR